MKSSREASLATVLIYLAKQPRLEELIEGLAKGIPVEYSRLLLEKDVRHNFIKLLSVSSISELDRCVFEIYRSELEYIGSVLPSEYSHYLYTFFEVYDFEKLLATYLAPQKVRQSTYTYTNTLDNPQYEQCYMSSSYRCLLEVYINRILSIFRKIYSKYLESYIDALNTILIFTSMRYFMYLKNSHILALAEYSYSEFIKFISQRLKLSNQLAMYKLHTILENIEKSFKESLDVLEIYEAAYVYDTVKSILYSSYQLIDQLTLYLINRYYEQRLMRYAHPLMSSIRSRYKVR